VYFGIAEEYEMLLEIEHLTEVMDKLNRIIRQDAVTPLPPPPPASEVKDLKGLSHGIFSFEN
jgi:hypothetical protein